MSLFTFIILDVSEKCFVYCICGVFKTTSEKQGNCDVSVFIMTSNIFLLYIFLTFFSSSLFLVEPDDLYAGCIMLMVFKISKYIITT